jgi:hypothetical protein
MSRVRRSRAALNPRRAERTAVPAASSGGPRRAAALARHVHVVGGDADASVLTRVRDEDTRPI